MAINLEGFLRKMTALNIKQNQTLWENLKSLRSNETGENESWAIKPLNKLNLWSKFKLAQATKRTDLSKYVQSIKLSDNSEVLIRPVYPQDEALMVKFHATLSERSVYFRWFSMLPFEKRVTPERMSKECKIDYNREMTLVAQRCNPQTKRAEIVAVAYLTKLHDADTGEFAVIVSDELQGQGLGSELINRLKQVGQHKKLQRLVGDIHPENRKMQTLCKKLGFNLKYSIEDQLMKVALEL